MNIKGRAYGGVLGLLVPGVESSQPARMGE